MSKKEKEVIGLEEQIGPIEPPTDAQIEAYGEWMYEHMVLDGFLKWFRKEKPKEYRKLTDGLVENRENKPGMRKIIGKLFEGYTDEFMAAGAPIGELDAFLSGWGQFTWDKPELIDKKEPSWDELARVLGIEVPAEGQEEEA